MRRAVHRSSGRGLTPWSKLFLAVALVCSATTRIPARTGGSQPITVGTGPEIGTVADLTWGVSHEDIDREVVAMHKAGIVWVRANQNWAAAEAEGKGLSNEGWMTEVDYAVTKARAAGLQVLMPIADGVPYWASADPSKYVDASGVRHWNKLWRPANNSDYAAFAAAMVNRYKPLGVRVYEVWNEPNHPFFWPSGPSATEYKELLAAAYPAIKGADPSATVLLGGLSKNDWDYMTALYAAGAGPYFDVANVHPYTGSVDPTWCWNQAGTTKPAKDAFCGIEEIRRTMVANGDSAKNMWITEFGWSTTTAAYGVSEATQADFLTKALTKTEKEYPYIATAFWFSFRNSPGYESDPTNLEANWGLVKGDLTPKPALTAVEAFTAPPPPVSLSISNATVVEGAPGTTTDATFTVSLSAPTTEPVSVKAATANSTAVAGSDYTALPLSTLAFAPGETTRTVSVPVRGDSAAEGNEYFSVNLSSLVGALAADTSGLGTILDEEGPPALSIDSPTAIDGPPGTTTQATFGISLSAPAAQTVTVKAATANSSAVAGSDYTALPLSTLAFAPGETTKTVAVAVSGDGVAEPNEYFVVNLSAPVGAVLADSQGLATIVDDEGPPTIAMNDPVVIEGGPAPGGTALFTVSLSAPAAQTVSVKAASANSSAVAGSDYTALPLTTLTFAPG
ncbi:MAG TPA: Calx-beta domain-containing protein, partial [Acidimicrobiales bacterium]|nr:Calx-beta domain-containing protein [Acidimicrobiales bacterium]